MEALMSNPMLAFLKGGKSKKKKAPKESAEPKKQEKMEKGFSADELAKYEKKEIG
jgi:hypothetical protein